MVGVWSSRSRSRLSRCRGPAGAAPIPSRNRARRADVLGAPATPQPIRGVPPTPRNPFMAPNGDSEIHDDGWQTDV